MGDDSKKDRPVTSRTAGDRLKSGELARGKVKYKSHSQKIKAGQAKARAQKLAHAPAFPAYGYRVSKNGKLTKDGSEQQMLRLIQRQRDKGETLRSVVATLYEQGYRTRKGTKIQLTQVARIVRSIESG